MLSQALEELSEQSCWSLLEHEQLGRVGFIEGGVPVVLPVYYRVDGQSIVFRSGVGSKLSAAV